MLTHEQNERLTRVGPGTPCGTLLRRYWQAVCPTAELSGEKRKKRIRILGEDLVVFRADDGTYRCVSDRCPHRSASLAFGFIEPDGIRCSYHGWKFDGVTGACMERPFEPQPPHEGIRIAAYPVEAYGGLLFVYMGPPEHQPLLPHWDVLARSDRPKRIRVLPVHRCNWLQIQENTADSVHTYYLHGHALTVAGIDLPGRDYFYRPIVGYDWSVSEWGIEKTLEYGGEHPETEIRPPLIFPNILRIPEGPVEAIHFRIPMDDEHTRIIWMGLMPGPRDPGESAVEVPYVIEPDPPHYTLEDIDQTDFYGQDRVVWEAQGTIADRSVETLGATDRGIVLYRRQLAEQIDRVERGEEPNVAVVRDAAQNACIEFNRTTDYSSPGRSRG
jgi:5,5'-dehydrodivanillate O-demethylase